MWGDSFSELRVPLYPILRQWHVERLLLNAKKDPELEHELDERGD